MRGGKTQPPTNGRFAALQTIASSHFVLQLGDVTGAFLETKELKGDQRLRMSCPKNYPLPDHEPDRLFEVVRPLHGLNDSPQKWYSTCDDALRNLSWTPSKLGPCVYMLWDSGLGGKSQVSWNHGGIRR